MDYRATWSMTAIKRSRRVTASKYVTSNPGGPIKGLKATATQGRVVDTQYNTLLCGKFFGTYGTPSQYGIGKSSKSRNEASVKQLIMNPINLVEPNLVTFLSKPL